MSDAPSPEDRFRLEELFERASELPRARQAPFVAAECGSNETLRRELARLLDALVAEDHLHAIRIEAPSRAGMRVGPYILLERVGEGGMGEVYAAEQQGPIVRRVALKIIKPGMDSRQVIVRFEAERQALARMTHPNIAQVFDGGTTESGSPYFAMEFVAGEPITEFCDRHKLSTPKRLELFLGICEGVQHAHQRGVIHRDLKPSNLLVMEEDGRSLPKVIDFGIARATTGRLVDRSMHTMIGQIVGTLDYMSPEQADPSSVEVDTRSDIYSLGVVLYQLLSGLLPFEHYVAGGQPLSEVQRAIREMDPPTPSTRLRRQTDTATKVAPLHGTDERSLVRQLSGDLDWVCMKALEKDPARRYSTVDGLALDIQRHLAGEPVSAAPPGAGYRLRKFVRRNRISVTAGAVVSVLLVLGVVSLVSALAEKKRADLAAAAETRSRESAEAISVFVNEIFLSSDQMKVLEAVDNALRDIDSGRFRDYPQTEASLQTTIANTIRDKGRLEEAVALYSRALETRQRLYPGDSREVAMSMCRLSHARWYRDRVANSESIAFQARAVEMYDRAAPTDYSGRSFSRSALANLLISAGRTAEAEPLYLRSLELERMEHTGDQFRVAYALCRLAKARNTLGRKDEARAGFDEGIAMMRRLFPVDAGYLAHALWYSASARLYNGDAEAALREMDEAMKIAVDLLAPTSPDLAMYQDTLARCREALGK